MIEHTLNDVEKLILGCLGPSTCQIRWMHTVIKQRIGHQLNHFSKFVRPQEPFGCVAMPKGRVKQSDVIENRPSCQQRAGCITWNHAPAFMTLQARCLLLHFLDPKELYMRNTDIELRTRGKKR